MSELRPRAARKAMSTVELERVFGDDFALRAPAGGTLLAPLRRVAIIAEAFLPKIDGVSRTACLTLRYLQQTGREVLVFAPDTAPPAIGASEIVALPSLGLIVAPETRMALPSPAVAARLEAFRPDLIHMFSPALMSVSGMLPARLRHIPVLANYQTDLPGYTGQYGLGAFEQPMSAWLRFLHNHCHRTLVPSRTTHEQLRTQGFRRLRYWGRGVSSARFHPAKRSAEWRARLLHGRDAASLICLYVGRLANEKQVHLLLEVAHTPGVALTIVGDGARRPELEALFAGTGTHFTGYLLGEELACAFASADVFAFTGPNETFGQVVQEAMASGLPAVVIDRGGVADLVHAGETGFLCPGDPHAFASAVRRLRDEPALRARMGARARQLARERPWEAIMAQLETHYSEVLTLNARLLRRFPPAEGLKLPLPSLFQRMERPE